MRSFDPDLKAKPGETSFQWARRTGMYSTLRICTCCLIIEANSDPCGGDECKTCRDGGLYEQAYAGKPGYTVTLGAFTDKCGHDLAIESQDAAHRENCEAYGFTARSCDLCGNHLHGDRYAATWWPKDIPAEYRIV